MQRSAGCFVQCQASTTATMSSVDRRVHALRGLMQSAGLDAFLVPSNDPHMVRDEEGKS